MVVGVFPVHCLVGYWKFDVGGERKLVSVTVKGWDLRQGKKEIN